VSGSPGRSGTWIANTSQTRTLRSHQMALVPSGDSVASEQTVLPDRRRSPVIKGLGWLIHHVFGSEGSVTDWSRSHPSCSSTSFSMATSPALASSPGSA